MIWFWIFNLIVFLISAIYIYKISYFYDYRYIGNIFRFIVVYYVFCNIILKISTELINDFDDSLIAYSISSFVICLLICVLFRTYLVNKFGKEERFANSEEMDTIGDLKE